MECDTSLKNRIKRAQGQMQGVLKMMEKDTACLDLLTQLKAIRSSLDKAIGSLTTENLLQSIEQNSNHSIDRNDIQAEIDLVLKGN